jgi:hypothetical protein
MADNLATKYAASMKHHPYGNALYVPVDSAILQPGSIGYIDEEGSWQPILTTIEDDDYLEQRGFLPAGDLVRATPQQHVWGPKTSSSVSGRKLDVSAGASATATGLPIGANVTMGYSTSKGFGAILHCPCVVREEGFYHHDVFVRWAKKNAQAVFNARPEVWTRSFYLVKKVYKTSDVWLNAGYWHDQTVTMGFELTAEALGQLGPHGEFSQGHSATGWEHHEVGSSAETLLYVPLTILQTSQGDSGLVVFFTFVRMRYMPIPFGTVC